MLFASAQIVNRARDQFLARAGLAQDEDVSLGWGDGGNLGKNFLQGRALADDISEAGAELVMQEFIFELEILLPGNAAQRHYASNHLATVISIRGGLHLYPMQLAVFAFHFELE